MRTTAKNKLRYGLALVALLLGMALAVYFTGDQDGKVAWSGAFTIDTTDPESQTKATSIAVSEDSSSPARWQLRASTNTRKT